MITYHEHYSDYLDMMMQKNKMQHVSNLNTLEDGSAMEMFQARRILNNKEEEHAKNPTGIAAMDRCRKGLEALDAMGWNRSFHQKEFHDG